ncbi:mucin-2-like isoform X2 [Gadus chalcogrammus]|uniref:mucin-2-like isoform X2 n=1 Tax=Gadus chalcogrammus TaxID=1042646 RepID=UPI0024C4A2FE|nr:mucin-2-like isoform X2 [Gadus chalcogrammus]
MQLLRSKAGQLFIVFFIHSFHNVKIQALPQSVLTASASSIREEESVTLQCSAKAGDPPEKCWIYLISPTNSQKNIAFECQAKFTGSVLLAYNLALAEVRVQCFYTVDVQSNTQPAPHSDIVSVTVRRVVTGRPASASPTSARPIPARPTSARPTSARPTSARPTSASPTSASSTSASPTPASPTSARPTSASPTSASPTPASPTSASPMPASPTSASPHKTVVNPNSVVPGSPTSTSATTAATTMVNSTPSAQYSSPGSLFLKAAIILIVCCGVIVFLIVLLFAVLKTWRRRKKNTMEMKSLNTGSSKVVNRSGSCIKEDGVYHVYSTISNEPSAPNQTLVYDLLQAN